MKRTFSSTTLNAIRTKTTAKETILYYFNTETETRFYQYDPTDKKSTDNGDTVLVSAKGLRFRKLDLSKNVEYSGGKPVIFQHIQNPTQNENLPFMPNNLFAGLNVIVAKLSREFSQTPLNADNCEMVYEIGNPIKSWKPGRSINAITGIERDKGYYVVMKADADLSDVSIPPLPAVDPTATVTSARNYEVEVPNGFNGGFIQLRKQSNGASIGFSYIPNGTGRLVAGLSNSDNHVYLTGYLDENFNSKLPNYPNGVIRFGVRGLDYYIKYNGVEVFKARQIELLEGGTAAMVDLYTGVITQLTPIYLTETVAEKTAFDTKILGDEMLGFKSGFVTGSIQAGGTALTLASDADAAKVVVGDLMYIEPTNRSRGVKGLKTWPNNGVATVADLAGYTASNFTWVHANGLTYEKFGDSWFQKKDTAVNYYNSNFYIESALPLGVRVRVLSKIGRVLTVDASPDISVTGARVFFDNEEIFNNWFTWGKVTTSPGFTLNFRAGNYFFGDYPNIYRFNDMFIKGANFQTVFTSCVGSPMMYLIATFCTNLKVKGIKLQSNVGLDGWGIRQYPRRGPGNVIAPFLDIQSGGMELGNANGYDIDIQVADTFTKGMVIMTSQNGTFKCAYSHATGIKRYNAWSIVTTDGSTDNLIQDCTWSSPTAFGAMEAFGGARNKFLRCSTVNGYASSNTSEEMMIEDCSFVFKKYCNVPGQDLSDPVINYNQNTGRTDGKFGGSVKNTTIHFEDYSDPTGNFKKGIVIQDGYNNAVIENVTITYGKPFIDNGTAEIGCLGILSTGLNTKVTGCKVFGENKPHAPLFRSNIGIQDGLIDNCEATTLFLGTGTIRNCKATTIYHGPNVVFEGTNIGTKILFNP